MSIEFHFPYGYEMMQDPDVVDAIMRDVAKLMERNCELAARVAELEDQNRRIRMAWRGRSCR